MIEKTVERLLPQTARKTFETMFFAIPDSLFRDRPFVNSGGPSRDLIADSVTFHGSPPVRSGFIASYPAAKKLAANFFGCDEASSLAEGRAIGVIAELSNMSAAQCSAK